MLQTGMRAPMGIKVFGPDLETIEKVGYEIENHLKKVEGVAPMSVFADRVVGKPYLEMEINRDAIARYGLSVLNLQNTLSSAIGGMKLTTTVEGRERFPVRMSYAREFRDNPEDLKKILIPTPSGAQIPLGELVTMNYITGPQMIKSENTFLVGYVIFDKKEGFAEVDVVENAQDYLNGLLESGDFDLPAGVSYVFTGNYENQIRATKRLSNCGTHFTYPDLPDSLFPVQVCYLNFPDIYRDYCSYIRWIYNAMAVWATLVSKRQYGRNWSQGSFPGAYNKSQCSGMGWIHCPVWSSYRRWCADQHLHKTAH